MEKKPRNKKLKDPYRLVLLKEDTLEEVSSYRLSLLNIYIGVSTVLVILAIAVASLIIFTPLRRLVPGYGDVTESMEYISLYNRVQKLEASLEAQKTYTEHFQKLLTNHTGSPSDGETGSTEEAEYPDEGQGSGDFGFEDSDTPEQTKATNAVMRKADSVATVRRTSSASMIEYMFFVPPVKGTISAGFDPEIGHLGTDVLAPKNTPIKAILDGYVIASDWTLETGNTIGIQHSNNLVSFYKHNSINLKKLGSFVKAGEAVAIIGNTGSISSGPHLHFELWVDGKPVNPTRFIDFH